MKTLSPIVLLATQPNLRLIGAPRALNCSANWVASSRVGERTSAYTPNSSSESRWSIGRVKAAVFPLPVGATAKTLSPARMRGMHWLWTGVGRRMPSSRHVATAHSDRPRSEKESDSTVVLGWVLIGGLGGEEGRSSDTGSRLALGLELEKIRKTGCTGAGVSASIYFF